MDPFTTVEELSAVLPASLALKRHQVIGANWALLLHKCNCNGVLADEMGLGKTIQVRALLPLATGAPSLH